MQFIRGSPCSRGQNQEQFGWLTSWGCHVIPFPSSGLTGLSCYGLKMQADLWCQMGIGRQRQVPLSCERTEFTWVTDCPPACGWGLFVRYWLHLLY